MEYIINDCNYEIMPKPLGKRNYKKNIASIIECSYRKVL